MLHKLQEDEDPHPEIRPSCQAVPHVWLAKFVSRLTAAFWMLSFGMTRAAPINIGAT